MKEKVAKFYKGDFIYENPKLVLSETSIELSICTGSIYEGFFTISGDKNAIVKGVIESSCPLLGLKTKEFFGGKTAIDFEFDASYLEVNDSFKEYIKVISDCGEYIVNINIKIVRPYFNSKMGKVMDLTRFTYLARYNWHQATDIFTSHEFPSYILSNDDNYASIRKQLLRSKSSNHALEEFLVASQQKSTVRLSINQNELFYDMDKESIADKVLITKATWGYVEIDISTDAPFIFINKSNITNESFIGNSYFLEFIILPEKMHKGNNYGRIYLKTTSETLVIKVMAVAHDDKAENKRVSLELKFNKINLSKLYLDYRFKNISSQKYITGVEDLLASIKQISAKIADSSVTDYYDMFYIQLLILNNEEDKGKKLLDKIRPKSNKWKSDNPELYWAYMALMTLYSSGNEAKERKSTIEKYYFGQGRNESNTFLSLIYLNSTYLEDQKKVLFEASYHFSNGIKSPYIYFEALKIFNENPSYLTSLDQFEIQIINFGIKYNNISKELAYQFVYLAGKTKNYNKLVFKILTIIYEQMESIDILNAICSLLIKGNKRSNDYFKWYKYGVLANLRIAELYEYFMHSIDEELEQILPHNLLYYFSYSNTLNVHRRSYLYDYVIRHKSEIPEVYKTYLENIEKFSYEQLKVGRINKHLALVYKEIIKNGNILTDQKSLLWNVLFRYDLECDNPNIKGIFIAYKEIEKETYIPLNKGKAQINLYNDEAEIFFIDNKDNLYYSTIDHKTSKIIDLAKSEILQLEINDESPESIIYTAYNGIEDQTYDKKSLEARQKLIELPGISREFYDKNLLSIIYYYYTRSNFVDLDKYLQMLDYMPAKSKSKHKFIELLIDRKFYNRAFDEIKRYGFDKLDKEKLYDLCSGLIRDGHDKEETLLMMSYYCLLSGKHNVYTINYLLKGYLATCKDLFKLWEVALSYNLEVKDLEAKILTQVLFTESREIDSYRVYQSFTRNGISSPLAKSFLNYQAYEYLVRDHSIDQGFFKSMEALVKTEQNDYCILALLKYYSNQEGMDEDQIKFAYRFLNEYIKRGIVLPFFKSFKNYLVLAHKFVHKTFVEVKAQANSQVSITYRYIGEDESLKDEEYTKEVLEHSFAGIFIKTFLLFYGEKVKYSISVVDSQGNVTTSEEKTLELGQDMEINDDNLYNQINFMKLARDSNDGKTFIDTYNNIRRTEYITGKVFKPL